MKKFIAGIAAAGLVLTMSGIAMEGTTRNQTFIYQVSAISELGISGNQGALIVDSASADPAPNMVSDADATYDYTQLALFSPAGADETDLAASADPAPNMVSAADATYDYTQLALFSPAGADETDFAASADPAPNMVSDADATYDYTQLALFSPAGADVIALRNLQPDPKTPDPENTLLTANADRNVK